MVAEETSLNLPEKRFDKPPLVVVFGLPYTGTTEVSKYIAKKFDLQLLSTDQIRIENGFRSGPETFAVMYEMAKELFRRGVGVVWDGTHLMRKNRDEMRDFADTAGVSVIFVYTKASPELVRHRMIERCSNPMQAMEEGKFCVTSEHFKVIAGYLEEPEGDEDILVVETMDTDPAKNVEVILTMLEQRIGNE